MPNFTTDDLLLYLYGELNAEEVASLNAMMNKDWALQQKLMVLEEAAERLDAVPLLSPRPRSIDAVMQYAEAALHVSGN